MIIIGVDFHPEFQQIASVDTDTAEFQEKRLAHREEAESFTVHWRARGCGLEWKPAGTHAGSNDWWREGREHFAVRIHHPVNEEAGTSLQRLTETGQMLFVERSSLSGSLGDFAGGTGREP